MKKHEEKIAKGVFYYTDILDKYGELTVSQLKCITERSIESKVLLVYTKSQNYILKAVSCPSSATNVIKQAQIEFENAKTLGNLTPYIAKGIECKIEHYKDTVQFEALYEYGGDSLLYVLNNSKLTLEEIFIWAKQSAIGLACAEKKAIFHSDIKPENITVKDGKIKIIDFGSSKDFKSKTFLYMPTTHLTDKMVSYTPIYCPPELLNDSGHYLMGKVDIYCWAMTFYQIISKRTFDELKKECELYKKSSDNYNQFIKIVKELKLEESAGWKGVLFKTILASCLQLCPEDRPSFTAIVELLSALQTGAIKLSEETNDLIKKLDEKYKNEIEKYKNEMKLLTELKNKEIEETKVKQNKAEEKLNTTTNELKTKGKIILEMKEKLKETEIKEKELQGKLREINNKRIIVNKKQYEKKEAKQETKKISICVKTLVGKNMNIEIFSDSTIKDVKKIVEKMGGVPAAQQIILFSGKELEDDKTCNYYRIAHGTTISLTSRPIEATKSKTKIELNIMNLFVKKLNGSVLTLKVDCNAKIKDLKEDVEKIEGISVSEQILVFSGAKLEDNKNIGYYSITKESTLYLVPILGKAKTGLNTMNLFVKKLEWKNLSFRSKLQCYNQGLERSYKKG